MCVTGLQGNTFYLLCHVLFRFVLLLGRMTFSLGEWVCHGDLVSADGTEQISLKDVSS